MPAMRHESSITSLSWIPSEAIEGSQRLAFDAGMAHYDAPPPEAIEDLQALRNADRFRFANVLDGGARTSTLVAVTPCRVACVEAAELDRGALQELSKDHRRTRPEES
jgi:predicted RNA methylase